MRPLFTLPFPRVLIDALNNSGFSSYEDLFKENGAIQELADGILKDYSYTVNGIKSFVKLPNVTSSALKLRGEKLNEIIPTFCEALDEILGGGVQLDSILHVCGPPGSGKTLLALQLSVAVQIPNFLGGLEGEAVFIDTESGFSVTRLREIAQGALNHCRKVAYYHNILNYIDKFSINVMLEKVHYLPARDHFQLMASIQILQQFVSNNSKIKIVIIDGLTVPFLTFTNTLDRTRMIYIILKQLSELASTFNLAVVIMNHLTTKISKTGKYLAPSLGESISHRIAQTLLLSRVNNVFSAVVTKSPYLPEMVIHFNIIKDGLRDITNLR